MTKDKATTIEEMHALGISTVDSYRYMCNKARGEQNLGHTFKDHYDYVNILKMKAIESGDAQTIINILHQQAIEEHDFFFRVIPDGLTRLRNVFWTYLMMKEDYDIFEDVVAFDTSYRTNRYNLIPAPFVRINNHWKTVMDGCAFFSNERGESLEWLFEVFNKSMGGKGPTTDQDQAMINALQKVTIPITNLLDCVLTFFIR